jgi:hypothetical protein
MTRGKTAMNFLRRTASPARESRQRRPVAAWVAQLERRTLLTLQVSPITTVAGQFFSGEIATFAAGDVQGTLANFQATIYWTGAVNFTTGAYIAPNGPGNYIVYGSNVYAKPGSYPINVVVTGANDSSAQASGTATVSDAPLSTSTATLAILTKTPFSGAVAAFQTTNSFASAADFTSSINWGDGSTPPSPGTISSNGSDSFSVIGQHTYTTVGTFPITVTIVSPGGQTNVVTSTAILTALPVSVFPTQVTGNAGQPLTGVTVATFLDPSISDTSNDFRATVDWGDGTINAGMIVNQGDGVFSVTGDHIYTAAGTYTINIQVVRAANGQTASASSTAQIGSPSPTFAFTGGLATVPANGPFISRGYATTNQPTFDGTAGAYAIVQLFARPSNADTELSLGETVADPSGNWSLATGPLAAGAYIVTAKVTPPAGYPSQMIALSSNNGTFFIDLAPASAVTNTQPAAVAAETSPQIQRSKTRHVTLHRTPKTPRARISQSARSEGANRLSHGTKNN